MHVPDGPPGFRLTVLTVAPLSPLQVVAGGLSFMMGLFNGFTIPYPAIPIYWRWLNRIVPQTWMVYGMATSQLGGLTTLLVNVDGSTTTVQAYLEDNLGYSYSMRWAGAISGAGGLARASRAGRCDLCCACVA